MDKAEVKEKTIRYFHNGYNCAEAVVKSCLEELDIKDNTIEKTATVFGRGIAGFGGICGAATGGLLVIGVRYGKVLKGEDRSECYLKGKHFIDEFKNRLGEVDCFKLKQKGVPCDKCIETSINLLFDLDIL